MGEYQKELLKFDFNKLRDRAGHINSSDPFKAIPDDIALYYRANGIPTKAQLDEILSRLKQLSEERESGFISKAFSALWFNVVREKITLTPKKLLWILTHLDKLAFFIKGETAKDILLFVDNIADKIYANLD